MRKKRYEILLPLKYNDGRPVEHDKLFQTHEDLILQFGAFASEPNVVRGAWVNEGVRYEDELMRICIDVDETNENHQFFIDFKAILLERFQQIAIYIASYPVDIL